MEQIKQLRQMRDEAQARIAALPDYKLVTSLDALIADLEEAFGSDQDAGEADEEPALPPAEPVEIEPVAEEAVVEENVAVLGAQEEDANEEAEAEETVSETEEDDTVSIFDRGADADDIGLNKALNFGSNGANGGAESAEATPEDEEADAISKAIQELDADLSKTNFGN